MRRLLLIAIYQVTSKYISIFLKLYLKLKQLTFFIRRDYTINLDGTFEVHTEMEALQRLGFTLNLHNGTQANENDLEKARSILPKLYSAYIDRKFNFK